MKKFPSQNQDKFTVRFPDNMRDAIAERAKENGRSMNSEIIQILHDSLDRSLSTPINEELSSIYKSIIEHDYHDEKGHLNYDEFDKNNEKIDWLIDQFIKRIDSDSQKFRKLLKLKKSIEDEACQNIENILNYGMKSNK